MGYEEALIQKIIDLYEQISSLESLKPCPSVNTLFGELVRTCMPSSSVDVVQLNEKVQKIRSNLIRLCGEAEGLLEAHFSSILGSFDNPIDHLSIFPYYSNYLKLGHLEFTLLSQHCEKSPSKVAFVGSGPLPLTSVVLALKHLTATSFHNYDINSSANSMAIQLVASHPDLSRRMFFHTTDIMDVTNGFGDFDVVFLAALVGMDKEEKRKVIHHLSSNMAPGTILMLRSAYSARAFLYPVIDPCDLNGFEVLSVFHPTDEVINSVIVARKCSLATPTMEHPCLIVPKLSCTCASTCLRSHSFNPMVEELTIED